MLLDKQTLDVARICSRDETRPALNGLRITRKFVEATDGHKLVRVSLPPQNGEDFPKIEGFEPRKRSKNKEVIIDHEHIADIVKSIPKAGHVKALPILAHAQIDFHGAKSSIRVATTDLDKSNVTQYRTIDDPFPATDQVFPTSKPEASGDFNANNLRSVLELAASCCSLTHRVTLELVRANSKTKLTVAGTDQMQLVIKTRNQETGQDFYGLVMPLRTAE